MIDSSGPDRNQAAALDADLFLRDPFPVNTRIIIFVANLQLAQEEVSASVVVNLVDSQNHSYDIAAEDVRLVPNLDFAQVTFRLPVNLPAGACTIKVKAHSQVSNPGILRIRI